MSPQRDCVLRKGRDTVRGPSVLRGAQMQCGALASVDERMVPQAGLMSLLPVSPLQQLLELGTCAVRMSP